MVSLSLEIHMEELLWSHFLGKYAWQVFTQVLDLWNALACVVRSCLGTCHLVITQDLCPPFCLHIKFFKVAVPRLGQQRCKMSQEHLVVEDNGRGAETTLRAHNCPGVARARMVQ